MKNMNTTVEKKIEFTSEERIEMFKDVLSFFSDPIYIKASVELIKAFPDYFFYVAASSTGKYHPDFSNEDGGLVKHTIMAMVFAKELFPLYDFSIEEHDMILLALLCHDSYKYDEPMRDFSVFEHPLISAQYFRKYVASHELLQPEVCKRIAEMIECHMGQWNTNKRSPGIEMPLPLTDSEKFVHLCDYLSSRKFVKFWK